MFDPDNLGLDRRTTERPRSLLGLVSLIVGVWVVVVVVWWLA